jgi:hypothetical protein
MEATHQASSIFALYQGMTLVVPQRGARKVGL